VEDVGRFAREMKAHILGIALLRERVVRLLSASDGQDLTEDTDEMTEGMVTIMAVCPDREKTSCKKTQVCAGPEVRSAGATNRKTEKLSRN
jgi:hypothetical protein